MVSLKKILVAAIRHEGPAILTEPKDLQNSQFMLDDVLTGVFKDPQDGAAHTALESHRLVFIRAMILTTSELLEELSPKTRL